MANRQRCVHWANGHSTLIRRPYYVDISKTIHVVSTHFFRCKFGSRKVLVVSMYFLGQKIHDVSTYFFRHYFCSRNIHGVSTYFLPRNFDGRKIHFVCTYFFRQNLDGPNSTSLLVICKLMKTFDEVFLC